QLQGSVDRANQGPLRVQVVAPKAKPGDRSLTLPGSVQALEQTVLYPRANGYLRKWNVDIGDRVAEGAVLAEIDTPEIDQQLAQARAQQLQASAQLMQVKANRNLAQTNQDRYRDLAAKGVASQQEFEQRQAQLLVEEANVKAAEANITAQQANVRRFTETKSFSHIVAPFAGQVNERMAERGALVSPASPLFKLSATDPVRVFVQVPQDVATSVRNDVAAQVTVREYPGRVFAGKIARASGSLDPATRTMTTEIRVPNPDGALLAGMYASAALTLPSPRKVVELPATALLNDAKGLRVAVVTEENKLKLVTVVVERDTGPTVEISQGLEGNERVVKLGSAELTEGRAVEILPLAWEDGR
ncbi:MAG: efflux RND transporter periplasmic adaptor subunit, partial [Myxococcales bacterium]